MPLIEWNEHFSVNEIFLDSHHNKLLNIINNLYDAIQNNKSSQDIKAIVLDLISYTKYHFTEEELLLAKNNYAQLEQQKEAHAIFLDKAWGYLEHLHTDYNKTGNEAFEFLKTWWNQHILELDMQYKDIFH